MWSRLTERFSDAFPVPLIWPAGSLVLILLSVVGAAVDWFDRTLVIVGVTAGILGLTSSIMAAAITSRLGPDATEPMPASRWDSVKTLVVAAIVVTEVFSGLSLTYILISFVVMIVGLSAFDLWAAWRHKEVP